MSTIADITRLVENIPENPVQGWKLGFADDLKRLLFEREKQDDEARSASELNARQRALIYQRRAFLVSSCSLGISILGFIAVTVGLNLNSKALRANTQQGMVRIVTDLDKVFIDHPELLAYFEGGKPISSTDLEFPKVYATAVMFLDVVDIAASQNETYQRQWKTPGAWKEWIVDEFSFSPILRQVYEERHFWYGDDMKSYYNEGLARAKAPSNPDPLMNALRDQRPRS